MAVNYTEFVFDEIRTIGRAWLDTNPQPDPINVEFLYEKIGEMSWRRLKDNKSVRQILMEIGVDPNDYLPPPPPQTGMFPPEQGRLHIIEDAFYTEDNEIWQWRGFSMFLAYRRFLAGEDLRPDLRQLRAWGANLIRVFGPLPWVETPDYRFESFNLARLGEFFSLVAEEGLRVEFVPFCYTFGNTQSRREFAQQCFTIMDEHWNVVAEMVNEPAVGDKPDPIDVLDGVDRKRVLTAYGYYPRENDPLSGVQVLDFATTHTVRDSAWFRKARHGQELQVNKGVPVVNDEPAKAIEPGNPGDPTNAPHPGFGYTGGKTNPDEFTWYGGVTALWQPGHTLHTEEGKWGCIPVPETRQWDITEAVSANVWAKIPAPVQVGRYTGAHLSSCPVDGKDLQINGRDIWTYASLHDTNAVGVRCAVSAPQPKPGWVEVERWGPGGSVVSVRRL